MLGNERPRCQWDQHKTVGTSNTRIWKKWYWHEAWLALRLQCILTECRCSGAQSNGRLLNEIALKSGYGHDPMEWWESQSRCESHSVTVIVIVALLSAYWLRNSWIFILLTYLLTPWSRVLLEKLTGSAASQEIPRLFGTRRFLTVPTSARHLSQSWANSIQ